MRSPIRVRNVMYEKVNTAWSIQQNIQWSLSTFMTFIKTLNKFDGENSLQLSDKKHMSVL